MFVASPNSAVEVGAPVKADPQADVRKLLWCLRSNLTKHGR
jgi:hypothetical protein